MFKETNYSEQINSVSIGLLIEDGISLDYNSGDFLRYKIEGKKKTYDLPELLKAHLDNDFSSLNLTPKTKDILLFILSSKAEFSYSNEEIVPYRNVALKLYDVDYFDSDELSEPPATLLYGIEIIFPEVYFLKKVMKSLQLTEAELLDAYIELFSSFVAIDVPFFTVAYAELDKTVSQTSRKTGKKDIHLFNRQEHNFDK